MKNGSHTNISFITPLVRENYLIIELKALSYFTNCLYYYSSYSMENVNRLEEISKQSNKCIQFFSTFHTFLSDLNHYGL